jgi:hypothetical protein
MTKLNLSLGILLIGTALVAGNFVACSSSNNPGSAGAAGTSAAGTSGAAGTSAAGTTGAGGAASATKPDGTCVLGAYKRMGVCTCQDGQPDVCPTVGCIDKHLDPDNCGSCGMKCGATQTCNNGMCGAAPTVVLMPVAGCMGMTIAANAGIVYYTDAAHNTVNKVGAAAPLAMNEMGATWIALQGSDLYWYNKGTKTVRKLAGAMGTAVDVYKSTMADVGGFLSDGTNVYISVGTNVIKVSATMVGGGTPVTVAQEMKNGIPGALALNGTTHIVYPTGLNGDVDAAMLGTMPASCGVEDAMGNVIMTTCPRLARSQGELDDNFIAVIGGKAYWLDGVNVKSEMIPAAGAMGGTFDTVAMADATISAAVASTDTIYFTSVDPQAPMDSVILKTPLAPNSTAIKLVRGQNSPQAIAIDASKVYWANADCSIGSAAK